MNSATEKGPLPEGVYPVTGKGPAGLANDVSITLPTASGAVLFTSLISNALTASPGPGCVLACATVSVSIGLALNAASWSNTASMRALGTDCEAATATLAGSVLEARPGPPDPEDPELEFELLPQPLAIARVPTAPAKTTRLAKPEVLVGCNKLRLCKFRS